MIVDLLRAVERARARRAFDSSMLQEAGRSRHLLSAVRRRPLDAVDGR